MKIKQDLRKKLSRAVHACVKEVFYDGVPIGPIDDALRANGCLLVQEDGTPWSGFLCGDQGRAMLDIASLDSCENGMYKAYDNVAIVLMWERFPSMRYEITAYVS